MATNPTFLSLFSGIGGLDLGLERAGWSCVGQVEIDPYCNRVLAKHWPDVPRWGDIKELDPDDLPRADLICGGFPCQPVSLAGRRQGQDDERWLWPELHRIVRALRPRWVLLENVPGLIVRGMGDVLGDLATGGYDAEWDCIPAAAVGAPHRRDRVWVVAYPGGARRRQDARGASGDEGQDAGRAAADDHLANGHGQGNGAGAVADASGQLGREVGKQERGSGEAPLRQRTARPGRRGSDVADPDGSTLESRGRRRGTPEAGELPDPDGAGRHQRPWIFGHGRGRPQPAHDGWWRIEPDVGRLAHGIPNRVDRLRALGNAVVPQVAEFIGRRILEADAA